MWIDLPTTLVSGGPLRLAYLRNAFDGAKRIRVRASAQLLKQCREFRLLR
jgi:hypothetical protein